MLGMINPFNSIQGLQKYMELGYECFELTESQVENLTFEQLKELPIITCNDRAFLITKDKNALQKIQS